MCNKVPYDMISMESCYYYLLSISFWICVCLHMLCIKVYRKTRVGETHRNNKTRFDRKNHEIQKATEQKPRSPKLDQNGPESGPLNLLYGLAGPPQCHLASCFIHSQVCGPFTLFFTYYAFRFEPN